MCLPQHREKGLPNYNYKKGKLTFVKAKLLRPNPEEPMVCTIRGQEEGGGKEGGRGRGRRERGRRERGRGRKEEEGKREEGKREVGLEGQAR